MKAVWIGLVVLLGSAGCASLPGGDAQYFRLSAPGQWEEARLAGNRFFGPRIEISLTPEWYRGASPAGYVDLRPRGPTRVSGSIGPRPTDLFLEPSGAGLILRGLFAGRLGYLELSPERLSGTVGRCTYQLQRRQGWYEGLRSCGSVGLAHVALPPTLAGRPLPEQALMLALFLGAG